MQFKVNGSPVGSPVPVTAGAATLPHTFDAAGSFAVTAGVHRRRRLHELVCAAAERDGFRSGCSR
ncbi:hypothetical protein GS881_21505 [Rhodococcus hoagii]|nr:hypothetical protein [Prescottella equi]